MKVITSKAQWTEFQKLGIYNNLPTFRSSAELRESGYTGLVGLRAVSRTGGVYKDLPAAEAIASGVLDTGEYYAQQCAPDDRCTVQGELDLATMTLFFCSPPRAANGERRVMRMREALRDHAQQLQHWPMALWLKAVLTPAAFEELEDIMDRFPGHIVEFSVYSGNVGDRPLNNWLVWEIRKGY